MDDFADDLPVGVAERDLAPEALLIALNKDERVLAGLSSAGEGALGCRIAGYQQASVAKPEVCAILTVIPQPRAHE